MFVLLRMGKLMFSVSKLKMLKLTNYFLLLGYFNRGERQSSVDPVTQKKLMNKLIGRNFSFTNWLH
jgi:hypothetical protein